MREVKKTETFGAEEIKAVFNAGYGELIEYMECVDNHLATFTRNDGEFSYYYIVALGEMVKVYNPNMKPTFEVFA